MKPIIAALSGALVALVCSIGLAAAQGMPQGSYLRSCNDVRLEGDTVTAHCRRIDGREERTALRDMRRCVGKAR